MWAALIPAAMSLISQLFSKGSNSSSTSTPDVLGGDQQANAASLAATSEASKPTPKDHSNGFQLGNYPSFLSQGSGGWA